MRKIIAGLFMLAAGAVYAQELFKSTRFDTTTTSNTTYIAEAVSNHPRTPISTNTAMWKIVKINSDGVFNLSVGGQQGYVGVWANLGSYATNSPLWK
jgi:hypothetical protein